MTRQLMGKVTLVTGGSSGIGRASALAFAREGSRVIVAADVNVTGGEETAQMIKQRGGEATFVKADVSKAAEVEALTRKAVETYGKLDCAFNNAGVRVHRGPAIDCTEEEWDRVLDINLKGIWLCMKYEIPQLLKVGGGAIVNMASTAGLRSYGNIAAYVASKHGVVGLTKAVALEYAKSGIRINAVCPGAIRTPEYERVLAQGRQPSTGALGRFGTPEEVAEVVVWLCSDAAPLVIGHAFPLDGGLVMSAPSPG